MGLLSLLSRFFGGSAQESPASDYRRISAQAARDMLQADKSARLVDVRTAGEYRAGHIPGSVLIPDVALEQQAPKQLPDKQATIIVHCHSGRRSHAAALKLLKMGYANVYDLGGIIAWPYETKSG